MRRSCLFRVLVLLLVACLAGKSSVTFAATIFESGTLGPTGIPQGSVAATNISPYVYTGVRFELTQPAITTQIGGHFVDTAGGSFFGAIIKLDGSDDFPDSGDLSTADVLGSTDLTFPVPSDEIFGNLSLSLDPGWYALVFGSGLFGTNGDGAAPRNNPDIGNPTYIGFQPLSGIGWVDITGPFSDHRFLVHGELTPEPMTIVLGTLSIIFYACSKRTWRP